MEGRTMPEASSLAQFIAQQLQSGKYQSYFAKWTERLLVSYLIFNQLVIILLQFAFAVNIGTLVYFREFGMYPEGK